MLATARKRSQTLAKRAWQIELGFQNGPLRPVDRAPQPYGVRGEGSRTAGSNRGLRFADMFREPERAFSGYFDFGLAAENRTYVCRTGAATNALTIGRSRRLQAGVSSPRSNQIVSGISEPHALGRCIGLVARALALVEHERSHDSDGKSDHYSRQNGLHGVLPPGGTADAACW